MELPWQDTARRLRLEGTISAEQCRKFIAIISALPDTGRADRVIIALLDKDADDEDRKALIEQVIGTLFPREWIVIEPVHDIK
jgi:hypothetical protein